jgi:hypothetical protein
MMPTQARRDDSRLFRLVLIKPTHYDDDGYPICWVKAAIPSNTLACLNGLAEDAARRRVLGWGVEIPLHTFDETNQRVRPARIIGAICQAGGRALIGLVGSVEPVSARCRSCPSVSCGGSAGLHRRLSCFRLDRDAAATAT